jgi:hypothetical protein
MQLALHTQSKQSPRPGSLPLIRAVAAQLIAYAEQALIGDVARRHWPHDRDAELIIKTATSPATMTTAAWAGSLAATAVADFLLSMGPASAGSTLLRRGLQLQFGGSAAIVVPGLVVSATNAGFVQEGAPIRVRKLALDGPTLSPRKFATITTFTREIFSHSVPNIEALVRATLTESVALALDTALLDATAGDATRPAGLRYNIAAVGATSSNPVKLEAMKEDIAKLAGAVVGVSGNAPIIFVASPVQALALRLWAGSDFDFEVLASSALASGVVVAIASNALCSAIDPLPRFNISTETTLHEEDTTPLPLSTAGTPNTVAAPMRSLFQTDAIGVRMKLEVSWALRNAGGLSWLQGVNW